MTININAKEGKLHFVIKDTGIGMNPNSIRHILEPYVQAEGQSYQEFGGTGADLSALSAGALIKNNAGGTAFEAAVAGTDYLDDTSLLGGQTF